VSKQYDIPALIDQMADELEQKLDINEQTAMVGIHTGGVWIAQRLHRILKIQPPLGTLDISFYRDDFTRIGMNPQVKPSDLPFTLDERNIILVDDVLHTGRTIRAAMNELFDYGRPASIVLVTLVERSGRELPIEANVVGLHMELGPGEHVKLSGPDPLTLETKSNA
jgi:pyrimidine operon attenuation protein/uracil phosphoribosyltransferase